jgi:hypothetical protein
MAAEKAVRGQREEEPTRYGAWREGQRGTSVVRSKAANGGQVKTGQRMLSGT